MFLASQLEETLWLKRNLKKLKVHKGGLAMIERFIVLELLQHQVSCCCPGQQHQHIIEFRQGDVLTITGERKYVDCLGWHVLIDINDEFQFFMYAAEIEELHAEGSICSISDLELRINYLRFKVDEALDAHDRESFLSFVDELCSIKEIKSKMQCAGRQAF